MRCSPAKKRQFEGRLVANRLFLVAKRCVAVFELLSSHESSFRFDSMRRLDDSVISGSAIVIFGRENAPDVVVLHVSKNAQFVWLLRNLKVARRYKLLLQLNPRF